MDKQEKRYVRELQHEGRDIAFTVERSRYEPPRSTDWVPYYLLTTVRFPTLRRRKPLSEIVR